MAADPLALRITEPELALVNTFNASHPNLLARLDFANAGLPRLRLLIPQAHVEHAVLELYLHGATITAWQPEDALPVLWLSDASHWDPDRPIRGGVPLCWPWFGPHPDRPDRPAHGFARINRWALVDIRTQHDAVTVQTQLDSHTAQHSTLEQPWRCALTARLAGPRFSTLHISLSVHNLGQTPLPFSEALHTYFTVDDVRNIAIHGLQSRPYVDKTRDAQTFTQQEPALRIAEHTDRVYTGFSGPVSLLDPGLNRRIDIRTEGSASTVVWNPWDRKAAAMPDFGNDEWPSMLCIEAANALNDAILLQPGQAHTLTQSISLHPAQ